MKKILLLFLFPIAVYAEGPLFSHKETVDQQEFENVYKDIRSKRISNTSTGNICLGNTILCVDPINSRVGINVSAPIKVLDIRGASDGLMILAPSDDANLVNDIFQVTNASLSNVFSITKSGFVYTSTSTVGTPGFSFVSDKDTGLRDDGSNSPRIVSAGADVIIASSVGEITQPLQPSFLATDGTGGTDVTGDGTVYGQLWPTEVYDQGSDFASNVFTAPITGRYHLTVTLGISHVLATHVFMLVTITTSNRNYTQRINYPATATAYDLYPMGVNVIADMDANDTASVTVNLVGGTKTVDIEANATFNYFSGSLIN